MHCRGTLQRNIWARTEWSGIRANVKQHNAVPETLLLSGLTACSELTTKQTFSPASIKPCWQIHQIQNEEKRCWQVSPRQNRRNTLVSCSKDHDEGKYYYPSQNHRVDAGKFARLVEWRGGHCLPHACTSMQLPSGLTLPWRGQMQTLAPFPNPGRRWLSTIMFLFYTANAIALVMQYLSAK